MVAVCDLLLLLYCNNNKSHTVAITFLLLQRNGKVFFLAIGQGVIMEAERDNMSDVYQSFMLQVQSTLEANLAPKAKLDIIAEVVEDFQKFRKACRHVKRVLRKQKPSEK